MTKLTENAKKAIKTDNMKGSLGVGVVAIIYLFGAFQLNFGSMAKPGSGFMPIILGLVVLIACLFGIVKELFFPDKGEKKKGMMSVEVKKEKHEVFDKTRPIKLTVAIIAYPFIIGFLGFMTSTVIFMFVVLRLMEFKSWWVSAIAAILIALGSRLLFGNGFDIVFPTGVFDWLI